MSKTDIVITDESHLDSIAEIEKVCFSNPWSRKSFADGMTNPDVQTYFTAITDGEISGYICIFHIFEDGDLLNIAVHPKYRRQGIAQMLMNKMFELLKEKGTERVTLEVRSSNFSAQSLYKKNGFKPMAIRKNYYSDPTEDGIVMEKTF